MLVRLPSSSRVQVGGRQAGYPLAGRLGALGVPGDHGGGMERGVDPGDEGRPPGGGVQADGAHPQAVEADRQGQQRAGEGGHPHAGTRLVGRCQAEGDGQAGAAAEQGVQAEALQEGGRVVGGGVPVARVRVGAPPGLDRGTSDDQVAGPDQPGAQGLADGLHEEHLVGRCPGGGGPRPHGGRAGHPRPSLAVGRQPAGRGERRPGHQPVAHVLQGEPPEGAEQRYQQQGGVGVHAGRAAGPLGQGHRAAQGASRTASWHNASRCRVSTIMRASRCSPDLCLANARWYAGGGTGAVLVHGAGTIG